MDENKLNANPIVHRPANSVVDPELAKILEELQIENYFDSNKQPEDDEQEEDRRDPFDAQEIFELIRSVRDPEHPLSLEELNVVRPEAIQVDDENSTIKLFFTPTVPHCSMSTLIGLCLRVKLMRTLPVRFKVDIFVEPGSHVSEQQVNKQLNDKERVAAALENGHLLQTVNKCLAT
jgi:metal-sulfur cluster biosynthetic enzyme